MELRWSSLSLLLALLLTSATPPVRAGAVSFFSFRKNDGVHGQSSASYNIQHGSGGYDSAHVEVLQSNSIAPGHAAGQLRQGPVGAARPPPQSQPLLAAPVRPRPAPFPAPGAGVHLGPNGVGGGPLGSVGANFVRFPGPVTGYDGVGGVGGVVGGVGGPAGLAGPGGPLGARLVHPGGPLDGPRDGPLNGPLNGPATHGLIRLRDDPTNRVGMNGRAPVMDSLPRPALRTYTGTPVWVPSYSNEPPSYEK